MPRGIGAADTVFGGTYQEDGRAKAILDHLELMAKDLNATPGQLALAWVLHKGVFPIIGARTLIHLESSLRATALSLPANQLQLLDE
ncbi:aldo/keto reductase [Spirosoma aerophilum]